MTAISRRYVLCGLAAAATPLPAVAAPSLVQSMEERDPCDYHLRRLREELENRHGGEWDLEINHERMTVFGRQLPPSAS